MTRPERTLNASLLKRALDLPIGQRNGAARRNAQAARRFFTRALRTLKAAPSKVVTDAAPVYPAVLDDVLPRRGITSSSTPTIQSRPITVSSSAG